MQCPACGNTMTDVKTGDITVDACKGGCGGLWFDHFELRKVEQPAQSAGESLLNIPQNPKAKACSSIRASWLRFAASTRPTPTGTRRRASTTARCSTPSSPGC